LCDFCPRWSPFSARFYSKWYEQEIVIFTHNQWCQFKEVRRRGNSKSTQVNFPRRGNQKWIILQIYVWRAKKISECVHTIDCNSIKVCERNKRVRRKFSAMCVGA
jgi:hypothetical protein